MIRRFRDNMFFVCKYYVYLGKLIFSAIKSLDDKNIKTKLSIICLRIDDSWNKQLNVIWVDGFSLVYDKVQSL